jgi:hypothetical protein
MSSPETNHGTRAFMRILLIAGVLSGIGVATLPTDRHVSEAQPVPVVAPAAAATDPNVLFGANAPLAVRDDAPAANAPTF